MPARNETTGQYTETYPHEEFLITLRQIGGEVGTKDIHEEVDSGYRTTLGKLHDLEERGVISSRKVGNAYLWSIPDPVETAAQDGIYDPSKE